MNLRHYLFKTWFAFKCLIFKDPVKVNGFIVPEEVRCAQSFLIQQLTPSGNDVILEFGCGTGMHLAAFSKKCRKVVGMDHLGIMVKKAKELNRDNKNVEVVYGNSTRLPFNDSAFDKIYSWNVFQYMRSEQEAVETIEELCRITKQGGRVFIGNMPSLAMRRKHTAHPMGIDVPVITRLFRRLCSFIYTYYDILTIRAVCQEKFGPVRVPERDSQLPWSDERFDLLIEVTKGKSEKCI